jgi:hypothetical protein
MGLDMYLDAKRYLSRHFDHFGDGDTEIIETCNRMLGIDGSDDEDYSVKEVTVRVAYWRKANAIHRWFIDNCSDDGVDDCRPMYVSTDQLKQLRNVCSEVLADRSKADQLLPTMTGFFFGNNDYGDYYFEDVQHTLDRLDKILSDKSLERCDFYYQASW